MRLEPRYQAMEKFLIAQMSINRLIRQIKIKEQISREKSLNRSQRLRSITFEINKLRCKRLRDKFIINGNDKGPKLFRTHDTSHWHDGEKITISICDLIKNERHIGKLIMEKNEIYDMEKRDVMELINLRNQLEECNKYMVEHIPVF